MDGVMGGERRDIDDIGDRRAHLHDLHRLRQADQQRADDRAAAQLLQQLGRDVGAVGAPA